MSRYWDDELYHHGIKGQSWGVENGPPYPLNAAGKKKFRERLKARIKAGTEATKKKISEASRVYKENKAAKKAAKMDEKAAERAEKRQKTLDTLSKSPTALYKNRDAYSTEELKKALDRINTEQKLHEMSMKELNRGKDILDTVVGYGQTAVKAYATGKQLKNNYDELFKGKKESDDGDASSDNSSSQNKTSNSDRIKDAADAARKMYDRAKEKRASRYRPYNGEWDEKGPLHGTVEGEGTSKRETKRNGRPRSAASRMYYKPGATYNSSGSYGRQSTALVPSRRRRRW